MKTPVLFLTLALAGCTSTYEEMDSQKIITGVPFFLGMEGSAVRLDKNWVLTSHHWNAILKLQGKFNVIYHPTCDIALIPSNDPDFKPQRVGTAFHGDTVVHTGYPQLSPLNRNYGKILGDAVFDNYPECTMVVTSGRVKRGMSGGGVYNESGELIGINQGVSGELPWGYNLGVYVHLKTVRLWLYEVTGVDYFSDTDGLHDASE